MYTSWRISFIPTEEKLADLGAQKALWRSATPAFALVVTLFLQVSTDSGDRLQSLLFFVINLALWAFIVRSAVIGKIQAVPVVTAFVFALVAVASVPPSTSKDVNSYAFYGRAIVEYGVSPYVVTPADLPADVWSDRVSYYWRDSPSVYGPLFSGISAGVMALAEESFTAARIAFQSIEAAALALAVVVVARRLRNTALAVALVGLNPLVLAFGVNDAHGDVLIGSLVLCGAVLLERRRLLAAGVVLAMAALVKVTAAIAVFAAVVWTIRHTGIRSAARLVGGAAGVGLLGFAGFGGLEVMAPLSDAAGRVSRFSVWNIPHHAFGDDQIVATAATITVAAVGVIAILRGSRSAVPHVCIAVGLVVYQVLAAYTLSWYSLWALPLLALVWRSPLAMIAFAHGCWLAIAYFSGYGGLIIGVLAAAWLLIRKRSARPALPWSSSRRLDSPILS